VTREATLALGAQASAKLRDTAKVVFWGLLIYAGAALVGAKLSSRSVGALAVQMVLAEWGAGRLGVSWSDPAQDIPTAAAIARRAGRGALLGLVAATSVIALALGTHALSAHANSPVPSELGIALFTACLVAARDELLLRGIPMRALRNACPPLVILLVCGAAAATAEYGVLSVAGTVHPAQLAIAGLLGIVFASLWAVDRGGWLAFGAHAMWAFATGGVIRGGILDLRASMGPWGGGDAGLSGSLVMAVALVPVAGLAMGWSRRAQKR
jgi:hypothetical protein